MGLYLNKGNDLFRRSLNSKIYVDKSELILYTNSVLDTESEYICVSRPRRFGKSMAANMLAAYYDKSCDSLALFKNLKIAQNPGFKNHLNKYDVIFLEIQNIIAEAGSIDNLMDYIKTSLIKELKEEYGNSIIGDETNLFLLLENIYKNCKDINNGFIFIIDEWDCIFREAKDNLKIQKEYLEFLRALFKGRAYVKLAYITGILPVKKYGTHSALNMFDEFSMTDASELAEFAGFTESEVKILCDKYNKDFSEVKRWYDGYLFEDNLHIYNPQSVISAMKSKCFKSFWTRTETYEALRIYFDLDLDGLKSSVITMLGGLCCPVNIEKFQNDMTTFNTKDDVFTLLVHLGYLGYIASTSEVFIPNLEIANEFKNAAEGSAWTEVIKALDLSNVLLEATLNFDNVKVAEIIDNIHDDTVSILKYNDENSLSCVITVAYYSARNDYTLIREFPNGRGLSDIVFIPRKNCGKPAMVVELKWNKSAEGAIKQIRDKKYANSLSGYFGDLLLVGINYDKESKKHECVIEKHNKLL